MKTYTHKNVKITKTEFNRFQVASFNGDGYVHTFKTLARAKSFIENMTAR